MPVLEELIVLHSILPMQILFGLEVPPAVYGEQLDGGSSWTILNNNETVLGVSDIAIPSDYATSNTIYIATGDRDGGSMWSLGGGQSGR